MLRSSSLEEQAINSLSDFSKIHWKNLEKLAKFFEVSIHFDPSHPQPKTIVLSALVGLLLINKIETLC